MTTLVQPAPPYSALYGLARTGLVGRDWAHRQAGLYPTHIRLAEAERRRALDLRPTQAGWLDLAAVQSVGEYFDEDGSLIYDRFPFTLAEPMLSDLFDRIRAYFASHAPFGQLGAEKGLARLCWLLAALEYTYRNDPMDEPFYHLFLDRRPTVEQMHGAAPDIVVDELVELMRRLHTAGGLDEMRRLAGHPPKGRPWGIARPVFGAYWSDNDILIGGPDGTTLIDVSSAIATNKLQRSRRWIWRLLSLSWLDTADTYRIRNVGLYFARHGVLVAWPLDELAETLVAGEDPVAARREFLELESRLRKEASGEG
ncbi:hypothetical protein E1298_40235 [Actinomadura rubrisoli]|uniref:Uncharacterized protein n=1 Tax=Actinomadura rubrisoli TaxID=2530368 RepID=A0A4R5A671_9ACTN|nr:hypothetical protein E1298_40235 [Actinomadura rubrisoli]